MTDQFRHNINHTTPDQGAGMTSLTPAKARATTYRKRPVEIEAMRFGDTTFEARAVYLWVEKNTDGSFEPLAVLEGKVPPPKSGVSIDPSDGALLIATLEGVMKARPGDYIIRGVQGEFYPCKGDIFEATYERVVERITDED